ncbi:ABC transporter ATP-binding protein [Achromobacter sp. F4_2707]|uniref:ABC transporter ATP-binding protein n=1 Tax=Achromobacter sp. F4_2707 TaxID=3114286 RepID=UPI0039C71459
MNLVSLDSLTKVFTLPMGMEARLARLMGAKVQAPQVHAVNGISLDIARGEVLGLVGESGCGKSTLARLTAGIHAPTSGTVRYRGKPVAVQRGNREVKQITEVQMIFQDPYASLNPRHRISRIIGQGPLFHGLVSRENLDDYVCEMMESAGLDPSYRFRYPHQFSGGQRQRIGIARALAMKPEFIVCDEAVAALDVSIQAQVLNLFMELRERLQLTYLFVSHDLSVVKHLSDRVAIMYLGKIVEVAPVDAIYLEANHPYTRALLGNMLTLQSRRKTFVPIKGEIPSPLQPPSGCKFHPRCPHAMTRCAEEEPTLKEIAPRHFSACHLNG